MRLACNCNLSNLVTLLYQYQKCPHSYLYILLFCLRQKSFDGKIERADAPSCRMDAEASESDIISFKSFEHQQRSVDYSEMSESVLDRDIMHFYLRLYILSG